MKLMFQEFLKKYLPLKFPTHDPKRFQTVGMK